MSFPSLRATKFPDLTLLAKPERLIVVGASENTGSAGFRGVQNLIVHKPFRGKMVFVNPAEAQVFGYRCWPGIAEAPVEDFDVALLLIPASEVMQALRDCAAQRVKFAIVWTPGFSEIVETRATQEAEMLAIAEASGMRIYGPNCPGVSNLYDGIGMTPSAAFKNTLRSGPIGLATQGGGLGRTIMESMERGVGIALWLSAGNEADLEISDLIVHMIRHEEIKVIAAVIEGVRNGPRFLAALKLAAEAGKPVVILKTGRSTVGTVATRSHTAALSGDAAVNSAVFSQYGAVEVFDADELTETAALLARRKATITGQVCVYSFSGGTNALSADKVTEAGMVMSTLRLETVAALKPYLLEYSPPINPLDLSAEALSRMETAEGSLRVLLAADNIDVVLAPIPMEYGQVTADFAAMLVRVQGDVEKPIVPVWMTDIRGEGCLILEAGGLLPFRTVGKAASALRRIVDYDAWRKRRRQHSHDIPPSRGILSPGPITEAGAKRLLSAHGIPVPEGALATTAVEARMIAEQIGYPVALKISDASILHKMDIGGVALDLVDGITVEAAFERVAQAADGPPRPVLVERMAPRGGLEVLVGIRRDPTFGPVMTVGLGGIHAEVLKDVVHRLMPIDDEEAALMLRSLRGAPLFESLRGRAPRDIDALSRMLAALSDFAVATGQALAELEINPVWVGARGEGVLALDAVILVDPRGYPSTIDG